MTQEKANRIISILNNYDDVEVRMEHIASEVKLLIIAQPSAVAVVNAIIEHENMKCTQDKRVLFSVFS